MSKILSFLLILILVTLSFTLGVAAGTKLVPPPAIADVQPVRQQGFKFISPLLRFDNPQTTSDPKIKQLSADLETAVKAAQKTGTAIEVSVFFRLPDTGEWFSINPEIKYTPASLIKVPIMMAYYHLAEKDPAILTEDTNKLIRQMIIESDNISADALMAKINLSELNQVFSDIKIPPIDFQHNENFLTVGDYADFFRTLYNATYLNRYSSETVLDLLTQTKFDAGLVAGVPSNILVAHKYGERSYPLTSQVQLHDCGIVYLPRKPYILCIMTRGTSKNELEPFIGRLSGIVYQNLTL